MARAKTDTIKVLSLDEVGRLFHELAPNKRNRAIFLVAYRHGLLASEVGLLRTDGLDFGNLRITIHRLKGRGSYYVDHPLQPDVAKALKAYLRKREDESPILFTSNRNEPISRRTLDWLIKKYGALANLAPEKLHFQVLRHSIAMHLLDAGADLRFVQDWLGHSSVQSTIVYLKSSNVDDSARKIFLRMPRY